MEENDVRESRTAIIATAIREMTYEELITLTSALVEMQKDAKEDGWGWDPTEVHGEYGLASMLHNWASAVEV